MTGPIAKIALSASVVVNTYFAVDDVLTTEIGVLTGMSAGVALLSLVVLMGVLFD